MFCLFDFLKNEKPGFWEQLKEIEVMVFHQRHFRSQGKRGHVNWGGALGLALPGVGGEGITPMMDILPCSGWVNNTGGGFVM